MDSVSTIAALAGGKRVQVISQGRAVDLPVKPEPAAPALPDPVVELSKQLAARDAENLAAVETLSDAVAKTIDGVKDALSVVAENQSNVARIAEAHEDTAVILRDALAKIPPATPQAEIELAARKAVDSRAAEIKQTTPTLRVDVYRDENNLIEYLIVKPVG